MQPIKPIVCCVTLMSLVVVPFDHGRTKTPPANVVGAMLSVGSTAATNIGMVADAMLGRVYDTNFGHGVPWLFER